MRTTNVASRRFIYVRINDLRMRENSAEEYLECNVRNEMKYT